MRKVLYLLAYLVIHMSGIGGYAETVRTPPKNTISPRGARGELHS